MMVKEYSLKFTQLASYAPHVVVDSRDKMSNFVLGVNDSMVNKCRSAMLNSGMNLARIMTHAQQIEEQKIRTRESEQEIKVRQFQFCSTKIRRRNPFSVLS